MDVYERAHLIKERVRDLLEEELAQLPANTILKCQLELILPPVIHQVNISLLLEEEEDSNGP